MTKTERIKIGSKLYKGSRFGLRCMTVVRITKTMVIVANGERYHKPKFENQIRLDKVGDIGTCYLETEEIKREYNNK